jgi:hypothetical protein
MTDQTPKWWRERVAEVVGAFRSNAELNPQSEGVWTLAANRLEYVLEEPQPSPVSPAPQGDPLERDWHILSARKWDHHDQHLVVRPMVDSLCAVLRAAREEIARLRAEAAVEMKVRLHTEAERDAALQRAEQAEQDVKVLREKIAEMRRYYDVEPWNKLREVEQAHQQLRAAADKALKFQYEHRGMGTYACRSCGAQATFNDESGRERREPCSPSCPWEVLRRALSPQEPTA